MVFLAREDCIAARARKRPRTPEVRQGEHAECGLAALAIVLGHHGVQVSLAELRARAGSTLFGSTVRQLRDLARDYGFEGKAHRTEPGDMPTLGLPLIAHMRFIHFVVVEHVGATLVRVNDPGCGPMLLDRAVFDRDFTGIALSLTPVAASSRGRAFSFTRSVVRTWRGQWRRLAVAGAVSIIGGTAGTAGAWQLASSNPVGGFTLLAASLVAAGLALLLAEQASLATRNGWAVAVFAAIGRADTDHFLFTRPDQTLARFSSLDSLQNTGLFHAGLMILWLMAALGTGCLLATMPVLPVAALSTLQLALVFSASTRRGGPIARHGHGKRPVQGIDAAHLSDCDWYRIGGAGDGLFSHLAGLHARAAAEAFAAANEQRRVETVLFATDLAKIALPLPLAAGHGLLLALALAAMSSVLIRRIGARLPSQPLRDALHRLADAPPESKPGSTYPDAASPRDGTLDLRNAGWSADRRPMIVEQLSCSVSSGQVLVVHGPPGSGTTTFARLASGLMQPTTGVVYLDGRPLPLHPAGTAMLVDHAILIVPGTVRDNLSLGAEDIGDVAMWAALDLVGLSETVARRGGLSFVLKPDMPRFSGGQLRRIVLARALCRAPRLLVLDEALDNVETPLAAVILDRLRARGLIVVLITKNRALIRNGDTVLDLGAGHVA